MYKVSVIICCYNASDTIERCFESVKKQTIGMSELQCIFVDDGSDDGGVTWEKMKAIEKSYPDNVLIIRCSENGRLGTASNIGLKYASGEYLQFLDADDELESYALEKLYLLAEEYQTDIVQYCHTLIYRDDRRINKAKKEGLFIINSIEDRIPFLNSSLVTYGRTNKFYKLSFVKMVDSHFAEGVYYEEPLFVYPLFLYASRVYLLNIGYYIYYLHDNSIVTSKAGNNLLDHPNVQLQLLEECMKRTDVYYNYREVIELYFLWTYYCETILFAGEYKNARLPLDYFKGMQNVCKSVLDWRTNKYIKLLDNKTLSIIESIDREYITQRELDDFILSLQQ